MSDSINADRQIRWEWWKNPLGGGSEYSDEGCPKDNGEVDVFGDDEDVATAVRPVIPTAAGLIPLQTYGSFPSNFNFWMMHTNFNLSQGVVDTLKRVPGVESCDVLSRYRARIGFGKCFKSADVKENIRKSLVVDLAPSPKRSEGEVFALDAETKKKVELLEQQASKYKYWAIYVIPNGEIDFIHADNEQEYKEHLDLFRQSQELAGGKVVSSNDR